jgi:hypothetical protein
MVLHASMLQSSDRLPMENQGVTSILLLTAWSAVRTGNWPSVRAEPSVLICVLASG